MWHEHKMPERWYELLCERMQIEEQRMRVIRDGGIVDNDYQEDLLALADSPRPRNAAGDEASNRRDSCARGSLKH